MRGIVATAAGLTVLGGVLELLIRCAAITHGQP